MNIDLPKMRQNVNNIQNLSDSPNTADGLTSQELKTKFDKAGIDIKNYLNDELVERLEEAFRDVLSTSDERLNNSRQCNNNFDNALTARNNLKIKYGNSLPQTGEDGDIFFLY